MKILKKIEYTVTYNGGKTAEEVEEAAEVVSNILKSKVSNQLLDYLLTLPGPAVVEAQLLWNAGSVTLTATVSDEGATVRSQRAEEDANRLAEVVQIYREPIGWDASEYAMESRSRTNSADYALKKHKENVALIEGK